MNFEANDDSDEKQDMKIEIIKLNSKISELNEDVQALLKVNEKLELREKEKTEQIEKQRHTIKDLKEKLRQTNETLRDNEYLTKHMDRLYFNKFKMKPSTAFEMVKTFVHFIKRDLMR